MIATRLFGPALLSGSAATKYTTPSYVPTRLVTRVTRIHLFNTDSVARAVTISIGADASGTRLLDAYSLPALTPYDIYGPFTLAQGEIVQAFADSANKVNMTMDGEEAVDGGE